MTWTAEIEIPTSIEGRMCENEYLKYFLIPLKCNLIDKMTWNVHISMEIK